MKIYEGLYKQQSPCTVTKQATTFAQGASARIQKNVATFRDLSQTNMPSTDN